jgi:hypothetical protein
MMVLSPLGIPEIFIASWLVMLIQQFQITTPI